MNIIPAINGICTSTEGDLSLPSTLTITQPYTHSAVDVFKQRLSQYCGLETDVSDDNTAMLKCKRVSDKQANLGWYSIHIRPDDVSIQYADDEGLHYALTSLYHLVWDAVHNRDGRLPCVNLEDYPQYPHRGLHVDTARHYFPLDELKRIVEQLALLKLNVFHWHLVDDQAWRLEICAYPELTEATNGQFYSKREVRELVEYAALRNVAVIPEIEMPGHVSSVLMAYPELGCREAKIENIGGAGVFKDILCAGKPSVYQWITSVLGEVCELFPDNRVHLGGDEAPKTEWEKCPHCQAKLKHENLNNMEDLQGYMLNFASQYLGQNGKQAICWNEAIKADNLDTGIAVQYWAEMSRESYCLHKIKAGRPIIFSEVFYTYFDYPHCAVPLSRTYDYVPHIRSESFIDAPNTLGIEGAIWTERVETQEQLERQIFPRIAALAEVAYTNKKDYPSFLERLDNLCKQWQQAGIQFVAPDQADPSSPGRIGPTLEYISMMLSAVGENGMPADMKPEQVQAMLQLFVGGFFDQKDQSALMQAISAFLTV